MAAGRILTVHELMGTFVLESGVCQRCRGPAHLGGCCETGEQYSPAGGGLSLQGAFLDSVIIPVLHRSNLILYRQVCVVCKEVLSLTWLETSSELPFEFFSAASEMRLKLKSTTLLFFCLLLDKLYVSQDVPNTLHGKMSAALRIQIRQRMSL